jgi:hypothetical protein
LSGFAERQHLVATQEGLEGAPQPGPEFNLAGDGPLGRLTHQAGIQHQRIGDFDRLTHSQSVAKCYRRSPLLCSLDCISLVDELMPEAVRVSGRDFCYRYFIFAWLKINPT